MDAKTIQKYSKVSTPQLRIRAGEYFRKFIRLRDRELPCICCGSWNTSDAGHYYSAGKHPELEFNEDNVNLCCKKCNMHEHGNLIAYRKGLERKIGQERLNTLDETADFWKRHTWKHDRFYLIGVIEEYKQKIKAL